MKYKINDIVYSSIYNNYGWIWDIKEDSYIVKWYPRGIIDPVKWGQYNKIAQFDTEPRIRLCTKEECILYGPKTDF